MRTGSGKAPAATRATIIFTPRTNSRNGSSASGELGRDGERVYVITNNHYRGQALANALQIKNMITGEKLEIPTGLLKQYPVLEEIVRKIRKGQLDLFEKNDADKGGKR